MMADDQLLSLPRQSMVQDVSRKDRKSNVVSDYLAVNQAIPRRELMPNAHEKMLMQGSALHRKRTRKPAVDMMSNPACADRQLVDAYELMRRNRNPALYRPTKADLARSTNLNEEHQRAQAAADVNTFKLRVLESVGAGAEVAKLERGLYEQGLNSGSVTSDATGTLRHLKADDMPRFDTYTKPTALAVRSKKPAESNHQPTYGHAHKPHVYNPLSNTLIGKRHSKQTAGDTGLLGVAQLHDLLKSKSNPSGGSLVDSQQGSQHQLALRSSSTTESAGKAPPGAAASINLDHELDYSTVPRNAQGSHHAKHPTAWDSSFASLRAIVEAQNPLPNPGASSLLRDEAYAANFRDKLKRSRASAAGMQLDASDLCFERQVRVRGRRLAHCAGGGAQERVHS